MVGIGPRKKLAEVIATDTILAIAVALRAQMTPDPRLAAMRSIWIEAEDDLSDAPGVAKCFAKEVSQTLPLTVVADKNLSQVVLRFRPIANRIELRVLLHDNQQLWSGTAVVPGGRAVHITVQAMCRCASSNRTSSFWDALCARRYLVSATARPVC